MTVVVGCDERAVVPVGIWREPVVERREIGQDRRKAADLSGMGIRPARNASKLGEVLRREVLAVPERGSRAHFRRTREVKFSRLLTILSYTSGMVSLLSVEAAYASISSSRRRKRHAASPGGTWADDPSFGLRGKPIPPRDHTVSIATVCLLGLHDPTRLLLGRLIFRGSPGGGSCLGAAVSPPAPPSAGR